MARNIVLQEKAVSRALIRAKRNIGAAWRLIEESKLLLKKRKD
jgi:hypothetical protein